MYPKDKLLYHRKDGRWEARYPVGRSETGRIRYASVYASSPEEASALRELRLADIERHSESGSVSFSEISRRWLDISSISIKGSTILKYQNLLDTHIIPEFGNVAIDLITPEMIENFISWKLRSGNIVNGQGLSYQYVKTMTLIINSVIAYAADRQLCGPLVYRIPRQGSYLSEVQIMSRSDQSVLEKPYTGIYPLCHLGILISLNSGLRIGEICALRWSDIDLDEAIIHVRHTTSRVLAGNDCSEGSKVIISSPKSKASVRNIPIVPFLVPILRQYYEEASFDYVVSDGPGFLSPRTFEYRYHRILSELRLPAYNYHVLRHTFATRCVEAGADPKSLSYILGHSNVSVTLNLYVHSQTDLQRQTMMKFEESMRNNI